VATDSHNTVADPTMDGMTRSTEMKLHPDRLLPPDPGVRRVAHRIYEDVPPKLSRAEARTA
jgi:hypothetical protein